MTQNMEDHLPKLSSRKGRYWLRDMQTSPSFAGVNDASSSAAADDQLPFSSGKRLATGYVGHESVVVAIPDVGTEKKRPVHNRSTADKTQQVKHSKIVAPIPVVPTQIPLSETVSKRPVDSVARADAPAPTEKKYPVKPDTSVPDKSRSRPSDEAIAASRAGQTDEEIDSIAKIANSIVAEFPVASPSLVVFVGSQVGLHTDETCARVAAELGGKGMGRVLLIDSDFTNRRLSKASGMNSQAGLSEIMNIAFDWKKAILKSGSSQLDFMSAGNCPHKRWTPIRTLKEALAEMKAEYQFICVSAGDAHDAAASMWAGLADGAMLLVSALHSSDAIAKSAVTQLRKDGARIFGCVVTDANEPVA